MTQKLLLSVSAQKLTAGRWQGRRLADCIVFANDEAGYSACRDYFAQFPGRPVFVIVDAVEEDYRFETLPHTFGADRRAMVARKLRQHYRGTPFSAAVRQGRDTGPARRRDDRYLFSALTNPDLLAPTLEMIHDLGLPLGGVYLLPMVAGALLEKVRVPASNVLLIALHSGGLRLTYFREKQFRVSRLTRTDFARSESLAQLLGEEIVNTRLYLHALHAAPLDERLGVIILDRNDELAAATATLAREHPSLRCMRIGPEQLATALGVPRDLLAASSDAVYLQLLGRERPASNLAPPPMTGGFWRYETRRGVYAACAACATFAIVWNAQTVWQTAAQRELLDTAVQNTRRVEAEYAAVTRQFPPAPASAAALTKAVEVAGVLQQRTHSPEQLMAVVARVLERSPGVSLKGLTWRYSDALNEAQTAGSAPSTSPSRAPSGGARVESGFIEGEVRPFNGDYRAAMQEINGLKEQLARDPAVGEARIVKLPLNVDPTLALTGNTEQGREHPASAEFKMFVVLKGRS